MVFRNLINYVLQFRSEVLSGMKVRVGSTYTHRGGCTANIRQIFNHPKWSVRKPPDNDVALGLLDKFLNFGSDIGSIKLPAKAEKTPTTDDVEVMSWGTNSQSGMFPTHRGQILQVYFSHLYTRRTCNAVMKNYMAKVTNNFMCVSQRDYKAPCTRDTGAPAVSGGILYGLASWGIRKPCGKYQYPAVFTYLGSDENWHFVINVTNSFRDQSHIISHANNITEE